MVALLTSIKVGFFTLQVKAGNGSGIQHTVALLTSMDTPIGHMIGNSLEVAESISCLHGNGPDDLRDLVVKLGKYDYKCTSKIENLKFGKTITLIQCTIL